ncbi:MAG: hypothetical protein HOJ16_07765 [Candidatus Peribacter sp.]|jgi:trimeric autotransporter adhesin|nr:hypothetical protein [Candidatus Peribacter sp.]
MARTRIGSKLIAVGGVHKDNVQSGSIEINHLDFGSTAAADYLVDLADADIIAVGDASNSTSMRGLKLGDLKAYISASAGAGGRTGSLQFAEANGGNLEFGGILTITSDGSHLTASGGAKFYFTNGALGTSPKHTFIHASADKQLDIVASDTGSGKVVLQGGLKVQLRTIANTGLAVGSISSTPVLMDGRDNGNAAHRANIRFDTNNSAPAVTIYSGSSAVFGTRGTSVQLQQSAAKLYFDNGTTYYAGTTTNVQYLTASAAKIDSLEVGELVSRTVTKDSLEIKDNLIIAAVSGAKHGDHLGAGFQLGGAVDVSGTGSAPLFSITLGDGSLSKGSMILNVSDARIASLTSGSFYAAAGAVGSGILAVTGAISASLARAQNVTAGAVSASAGTFHRIVTNKLAGTGIVTQDNLQTGSIQAAHIGTGQVTHAKLATGAITADNIQSASVNTAHIVDSAVTTAKINAAAITKAKIGTGAVTLDKLATGSVQTPQLGALVVTKAKIGTGAVTLDKLATGSVQTPQLGALVVTKAKIGTGAVTLDKMATGSVSTPQLGALVVTKAKIATGAVTLDKLATGSVGDKQLAASVVQNNADAHGGLNWTSGKLSIGFQQKTYMRHTSTGSAFVTDGLDGPYTTASLGARPQSGSVMVYLNGVLLAGEHFSSPGAEAGSTQADYRINSASVTDNQIHLHPNLALDADDILTVTFFSGSV